jgi:hypothetical protein
MHVVLATSTDQEDWAAMRRALWLDADNGDMARILNEPARFVAFIARSRRPHDRLCGGFAKA